MTDSEKLMKIMDIISDMELIQERVRVMAGIIDEDYFDLSEDYFKLFYFDKASTELDILFDYILKNTELLKQVKELLRCDR